MRWIEPGSTGGAASVFHHRATSLGHDLCMLGNTLSLICPWDSRIFSKRSSLGYICTVWHTGVNSTLWSFCLRVFAIFIYHVCVYTMCTWWPRSTCRHQKTVLGSQFSSSMMGSRDQAFTVSPLTHWTNSLPLHSVLKNCYYFPDGKEQIVRVPASSFPSPSTLTTEGLSSPRGGHPGDGEVMTRSPV